jgi:hypothetical protein
MSDTNTDELPLTVSKETYEAIGAAFDAADNLVHCTDQYTDMTAEMRSLADRAANDLCQLFHLAIDEARICAELGFVPIELDDLRSKSAGTTN